MLTTVIHRPSGSVAEIFTTATKNDLDRWCAVKVVIHTEEGVTHVFPFTAIGQITQENT